MTRAQRLREADGLLKAARYWQNHEHLPDAIACRCDPSNPVDALCHDLEDLFFLVLGESDWKDVNFWDIAALSEAARLADDELVNEED